MKNFIVTFLLAIYSFYSYAQLNITGSKLVCPGVQETYTTAQPLSGLCQVKWTVTNGIFPYTGGTEVIGPIGIFTSIDVIWNNVQASSSSMAPTGTIKVERFNCDPNLSDLTSFTFNNVLILTLNNITP
nr:hypothetical protein [Cytophagales bacterium]